MIYLIVLHAYAFPNNVQHLQDIANYFNDKPFLSCTFNGYLVDCAKMKQLQEKQFAILVMIIQKLVLMATTVHS